MATATDACAGATEDVAAGAAATVQLESGDVPASPSNTTAGVDPASSATSAAAASVTEQALQQFKTVVSLNDLTARGLTDGVRQCIETATQMSSLDLIERLMHGYKPNNVSSFRKRVLALLDADPHAASTPEQPDLPQRLQQCLAARRSQLLGRPTPERARKRQRVQEAHPPTGSPLSAVEQQPEHAPSVPSAPATEPRAVTSSTGTDDSGLLQQLAGVFGVEVATIKSLRRQGESFSCVDVTMLLTGKGRDYAAQQIRYLRERYPEVSARHTNIKFAGRGQRETPVGDVYAIVELIFCASCRMHGQLCSMF